MIDYWPRTSQFQMPSSRFCVTQSTHCEEHIYIDDSMSQKNMPHLFRAIRFFEMIA